MKGNLPNVQSLGALSSTSIRQDCSRRKPDIPRAVRPSPSSRGSSVMDRSPDLEA